MRRGEALTGQFANACRLAEKYALRHNVPSKLCFDQSDCQYFAHSHGKAGDLSLKPFFLGHFISLFGSKAAFRRHLSMKTCYAFAGNCIAVDKGGFSGDAAVGADDFYDFYSICRKAMDENAEFQCKQEPKTLTEGQCNPSSDDDNDNSNKERGSESIGGGNPESQFFPFGATTTTAVVDDSTLNQQKSVISVGVAVVSSSVTVVLIAAIVAGTVLIVISRSRKRVERDNDAPKDSAPSSLLLFEGVVDYGARRCHLDCESTVDL